MKSDLALHGGTPVRPRMLPYARQIVDEEDRNAVLEVLGSDWLTTGPAVERFEKALAETLGAPEVVVVSNGTAALHAAVHAAGIGPGDEVVVPALTFVASANAVVFAGGKPVFADVDSKSLSLDPESVKQRLTDRTKAIIAVDYAGQPCRYDELVPLAKSRGLTLIADACHALGGSHGGRKVGTLADLSTFSFHPAKHITTAEGGAISTADPEAARRMRRFRNHGIDSDLRSREAKGTFAYQMVDLGYNYRLSDLQCALGISQLKKLGAWVEKRRQLARLYDTALASMDFVEPVEQRLDESSYHLYIVQLRLDRLSVDRDVIHQALRAEGIGANVHYMPVHLHEYYRKNHGTRAGDCPVAEKAYPRLLSLPLFPGMQSSDVEDVVTALAKVGRAYRAP